MSAPTYRLFVAGLPWALRSDGLRSAFAKFGPVAESYVVMDKGALNRSRGFGFVTFEEREAMEKALTEAGNFEIEGRKIVMNEARADNRPPREPRSPRTFRDNDRGDRRRGNFNRDEDF
eukprot:comp24442_c0_seq1/m.46709 comp24442_c0_seq1/g.46709  ORF comp24442_c0_seq1/g.46709 comp24442_c0_seq1/m.46709 type:complete len:119 (-) comp24442_c0_seq1:560-916(-)